MTKTSKEYAEALFALALENDSADEFAAGLDRAVTVLEQNPEYMDLLACYAIPAAERTAALDEVFADTLPEYVLSTLQLLCEHGHIRSVFECQKSFEELYFEYRRIAAVRVTSVVELTPDQKARLETKLRAMCKREISAVYVLDPAILGGIVVEVDGKILDSSVKHRLRDVKDVIDA